MPLPVSISTAIQQMADSHEEKSGETFSESVSSAVAQARSAVEGGIIQVQTGAEEGLKVAVGAVLSTGQVVAEVVRQGLDVTEGLAAESKASPRKLTSMACRTQRPITSRLGSDLQAYVDVGISHLQAAEDVVVGQIKGRWPAGSLSKKVTVCACYFDNRQLPADLPSPSPDPGAPLAPQPASTGWAQTRTPPTHSSPRRHWWPYQVLKRRCSPLKAGTSAHRIVSHRPTAQRTQVLHCARNCCIARSLLSMCTYV